MGGGGSGGGGRGAMDGWMDEHSKLHCGNVIGSDSIIIIIIIPAIATVVFWRSVLTVGLGFVVFTIT